MDIDSLFSGNPREWVDELPEYSKAPINQLLEQGCSFDEIAEQWVSATAANTFRLAATQDKRVDNGFVMNVKKEIREFLCGAKYKKEREGLFGKGSVARLVIVSTIATAIAPTVGVAAVVITPVVALVLASMGKIAINAWCQTS